MNARNNAPLPIGKRVRRRFKRWLRRRNRARALAHLPPALVTSVPKSGTHLLQSALQAMEYRHVSHQPFNPDVRLEYDSSNWRAGLARIKSGEFVTDHVAWDEKLFGILRKYGIRALMIYRDPRAVCWSFIQYHLKNDYRFGDYLRSMDGDCARVRAILDGIPDGASAAGAGRDPLGKQIDMFAGWRQAEGVGVVSFEELVGIQGGGDASSQRAAIERMLRSLSIEATEDRLERVAGSAFNTGASNFRKGKIDSWREEASDEAIRLMNDRLEKQILEWGYEVE